ncbi:hypothetical protein [Streptomyces sp. BH055]|uniref:hypothetical protein n=1 Tax=unclassified Streptomyces TaxID=2593676 RepID=UPI003BB7EB02
MRKRLTFRRPRPAVLLAAGLATALLGAAGVITTTDADADGHSARPAPARTATAAPPPSASRPLVQAFNSGWKAGVKALGTSGKATKPGDLTPQGDAAWGTAWYDGWVDGQADALGDDNRDGKVARGETGYDPCAGEVEFADMCARINTHPAFAYSDENDRVRSVASGHAQLVQLRQIGVKPGSDRFAAALSELDTQWVQHNEN